MPKRQAPETRFWDKVDQSGGPDTCWPWTARKNWAGYGMFYPEHGKGVNASRYAWYLANGRWPNKELEHVCHRCDNPSCCNPTHLFLGNRSDNMRDCVAKMRHGSFTKPEQRGRRKLTRDQVLEIIDLLRCGELTQAQIGARYGVTYQAIHSIRCRQTWKHLPR